MWYNARDRLVTCSRPSKQRTTPLSSTPPVNLPRLRFLIVNGFTSFNLMIGVLSLIIASTGRMGLAAWGLLLCVLLDSCDGSLARYWQVTSEFGAQLDSLA